MDTTPKKRMRVVLATVTLPRIIGITAPTDGKCNTCASDTKPINFEKSMEESTKCTRCLQHCTAAFVDEELQKLQKELDEMRRLLQKEKCEAEKLLNEKQKYLRRMLNVQQNAVEKIAQNNKKLREDIEGMRQHLECVDDVSEHSLSQDELTIDEMKITPEMVRAIVLPKITDVRSCTVQPCSVELKKMTDEEINRALCRKRRTKSIPRGRDSEEIELEMPQERTPRRKKRRKIVRKFPKSCYVNRTKSRVNTPMHFENEEMDEENSIANVCEQQMYVGEGFVQLS